MTFACYLGLNSGEILYTVVVTGMRSGYKLLRFLVEKLGHLSPDFGTLKSPCRNIFVLLSSSVLKYEFSQHTPAKEQVKTLIFLHI